MPHVAVLGDADDLVNLPIARIDVAANENVHLGVFCDGTRQFVFQQIVRRRLFSKKDLAVLVD